jgi:cobalt/nickel transport system permease protein
VLHRTKPECKVLATLLFVLAVVATPREAMWAYAVYALLLAVAARAGRVPTPFVARRLVVEIPFLLFAALLPFTAGGERIDVAGVSVAIEGLWGAWNILAKATLGAAATVVLAATTPAADMLRGLERLRVPRVVTAIAGFMIRYADVMTGEMRRMRIARESRGHTPRWLGDLRAIARSIGALFIRGYERGERVYLAMLSRGFDGSLPVLVQTRANARQWMMALTLPATASVVAFTAWMTL